MTAKDEESFDVHERDRTWLKEIAAGGAASERAVTGLFMAYRGALLGWLKRHQVNPNDADDIVQLAFMKLVHAAGQHRGDGSVRAWLYTIVRNCWMDELRKTKPETHLDDDGWEWISATISAPAHRAVQDSTDDCVADGFQRYSQDHPDRAEVVRRQVLDKWTVRDIAQYLQRTEAATFEYLSQCRKKLRPYIEPCLALASRAA
ncbi:MAG: RNA polymerase sigma factor [Ideonella sp.]|nr:RNA polymerase sigma factor [Ideonella sp.]